MATIKQAGALLLVTGAGLAVWSLGDRTADDGHEVGERISTVRLESSRSDVTVRVADVERTTIEQKRTFWLFHTDDGFDVDGDTLKLDGDCGWNCRADYVVTVPRGTTVTGHHGSGDLHLTGVGGVDLKATSGELELTDVAGDVKLDVTSGDVTVHQPAGRLDVTATSGDLEATAVRGPVNVRTTSGDLTVELAEPADVVAEGTSGDVEVFAPAGQYDVETSTRSGDVDNELTDSPGAEHTLRATTVSGDVEVRAQRS